LRRLLTSHGQVPGQPTSDIQAVARTLYPGDVLEVIERESRGHDILDLRGADEIPRGFVDLADQDRRTVILRPESRLQRAVDYPLPIHVGDGHKELDTGLEQDERLTEEDVTCKLKSSRGQR
jgi:hypothetical protein